MTDVNSPFPNERNMMLAAEQVVKRLEARVTEAEKSADRAKAYAAETREQAKRWKRFTVALAIVAVLLAASGGVIWNLTVQQANATNQLRQQAIAACNQGNVIRGEGIQIWEKNFALQAQLSASDASLLTDFISVLSNGDPAKVKRLEEIFAKSGSANAAEVQAFLKFVEDVNSPRNCNQAYSVTPAAVAFTVARG